MTATAKTAAAAETAAAPLALHYDAFGRLAMTLPGGSVLAGIVPVRCFPFSSASEWISLCDATGVEVHCVRDLRELPADVRGLLEKELAQREFIPEIERILSVSPGAEPTVWHVRTDRGETRFTLPTEDHIHRLGDHGALITDEHGIRFRISDVRSLDSHSRKILNQYL